MRATLSKKNYNRRLDMLIVDLASLRHDLDTLSGVGEDASSIVFENLKIVATLLERSTL